MGIIAEASLFCKSFFDFLSLWERGGGEGYGGGR
jgi:hypothetical protein